MDFSAYLSLRAQQIDEALREHLPPAETPPSTLHQAMLYSLMAGGKRLRPILCLASAEAVGGAIEAALPLACAVECIHTYSLVHDDLPCMDNDDFRRGKPTNHKVFGEGIAVLAGDALLTEAFAIVAKHPGTSRYSTAYMIADLALAAGSKHLIGGQVADLEAEGQDVSPEQLDFIHNNKTSALLACAIRLGAMSANAEPADLETLTRFGQALGLAFQVIDDILDLTQTTEVLGKSAGKDIHASKATYPAVHGLQQAQNFALDLTQQARQALNALDPDKSEALHHLADHLLKRNF
ncbi:MAG: polyprenyl synthetase family protein [Verrucomicrobiales bacterium]